MNNQKSSKNVESPRKEHLHHCTHTGNYGVLQPDLPFLVPWAINLGNWLLISGSREVKRVTIWNAMVPEEPIGSMLTARDHVFSDSVFCTGLGASDSVSNTKIWNRWQKQSRTVPIAKTEMSLQVSRLTLDGTCVWVTHWRNHCASYNTSCPKPGMTLRIDRQDHLREHLQRHHQLGKSKGAKQINV